MIELEKGQILLFPIINFAVNILLNTTKALLRNWGNKK